MTLPPTQKPRAPRKPFPCSGCGGLTDGRHIDRELLPASEPRKEGADPNAK